MDFALTDDQGLFRRIVREFAAGALAPVAAAADESGAFSAETLRQAADVGLFGLLVPEAYDGAEVDTLRFVLALEEVARASAALASVLNTQAVVCLPLLLAGTEAQRARWLPRLARGDVLGASLAGEMAQRNDSPPLALRAVAVDGAWRLDGEGRCVPNGGAAAVYLVFAATGASAGDPAPQPEVGELEPSSSRGAPGADEHRLSAFLVEASTPGLRAGPALERLGLRGAVVAEVALDGCRLPAETLVGAPGAGLRLVEAALDLGRLGAAAQALGIAQVSLDAALAYAQERQQFGRPIAEFQGLRWMLADLHLAVEAARLLTYRAAWLRDRGQAYGQAAAMAKLHAAETAMQAATKAVQIHGGYGYMRESPVQRYFRDAKVVEIDRGTSEHQRSAIADGLLPPPA